MCLRKLRHTIPSEYHLLAAVSIGAGMPSSGRHTCLASPTFRNHATHKSPTKYFSVAKVMAVPATLDNRTEGRLKRSTDGDELKNTLIVPDRRNAHYATPLSCYQGHAPSGWLRSSLARNLRTFFPIFTLSHGSVSVISMC